MGTITEKKGHAPFAAASHFSEDAVPVFSIQKAVCGAPVSGAKSPTRSFGSRKSTQGISHRHTLTQGQMTWFSMNPWASITTRQALSVTAPFFMSRQSSAAIAPQSRTLATGPA